MGSEQLVFMTPPKSHYFVHLLMTCCFSYQGCEVKLGLPVSCMVALCVLWLSLLWHSLRQDTATPSPAPFHTQGHELPGCPCSQHPCAAGVGATRARSLPNPLWPLPNPLCPPQEPSLPLRQTPRHEGTGNVLPKTESCPWRRGEGEQGQGKRGRRGEALPLRGKIDELCWEPLCWELWGGLLHHLLQLLEGSAPGVVGEAQDGQLDLQHRAHNSGGGTPHSHPPHGTGMAPCPPWVWFCASTQMGLVSMEMGMSQGDLRAPCSA